MAIDLPGLFIGLGVSAVGAFARWRFPVVHRSVADGGIAAGAFLVILGALNRTDLWVWLAAVAGLATWASWSVTQVRRLRAALAVSHPPEPRAPLTIISNKTYGFETVKIDGNRFINCTFTKTVIHWDGGEFLMEGCRANHCSFATFNATLRLQMRLLHATGLLNDQITPLLPDIETAKASASSSGQSQPS